MISQAIKLFILLMSINIWAESHIEGQLSVYSTSDKQYLKRTTLIWRSERGDSHWPYPGEQSSFWSYGLGIVRTSGDASGAQMKGLSIPINLSRKISNSFTMNATIAPQKLSIESQGKTKNKQRVSPIFNFFWSGSESLGSTSLKLSEDYLHGSLYLPGGVSSFLTVRHFNLSHLWRKFSRIRVTSQLSRSEFSNDNQIHAIDSEAKYSLPHLGEWVWLGLGLNYISADRQDLQYWSPEKFFAYGPRLEFSTPLGEKLHFSMGVNYSWQQENDFEPGSGYYMAGSLRYGARDQTNVSLNFEDIKSFQGGNEWSGRQFGLSFNHFF